jgi:hypothetical protein
MISKKLFNYLITYELKLVSGTLYCNLFILYTSVYKLITDNPRSAEQSNYYDYSNCHYYMQDFMSLFSP